MLHWRYTINDYLKAALIVIGMLAGVIGIVGLAVLIMWISPWIFVGLFAIGFLVMLYLYALDWIQHWPS